MFGGCLYACVVGEHKQGAYISLQHDARVTPQKKLLKHVSHACERRRAVFSQF